MQSVKFQRSGNEGSTKRGEAGDGSPRAVFIEGTHSNTAESVFSELARQAGKLTTLEKFYALAPADAVPHPILVDAHAAQTESLGRADASVRHVEFDPTLVLKAPRAPVGRRGVCVSLHRE